MMVEGRKTKFAPWTNKMALGINKNGLNGQTNGSMDKQGLVPHETVIVNLLL